MLPCLDWFFCLFVGVVSLNADPNSVRVYTLVFFCIVCSFLLQLVCSDLLAGTYPLVMDREVANANDPGRTIRYELTRCMRLYDSGIECRCMRLKNGKRTIITALFMTGRE